MDKSTPTPKPKPKRRTARVKAVQAEIITRRLAGEDVRTVAAAVGVDKETVGDVFDEYWALSADERSEETENARERTLARYRLSASEAWAAWRDSATETADDGTTSVRLGRANFRFLELYLKALEKIAKYEGLDAALAVKLELSGPDGGPIEVDLDGLSDDELRRLAGED